MKPTIQLAEAHAIVTGGAQGIGLATVKRLLAAGSAVTAWDLDQKALDAAQKAVAAGGYADRFHVRQCDVTNFDQVVECWKEAEAFIPVDILINNAGILVGGQFDEQPYAAWHKTLAVNLDAVMHLTHIALGHMYNRARGHIVNVSSASAMVSVPGLTAYAATKWGVWGFSESLRAEARPRGVMVSSVHPSYIAEGLFAGARLKGLGSLIVPRIKDHDVVARAIVEVLLKKGKNMAIRPRSVRSAVFLRGILPDRAFQWVVKNLGVWESMAGWHGYSDKGKPPNS